MIVPLLLACSPAQLREMAGRDNPRGERCAQKRQAEFVNKRLAQGQQISLHTTRDRARRMMRTPE